MTLPIGRRTESPGFTDGRDGSNASMSSTGVVAREPSGVARYDFALERKARRWERRISDRVTQQCNDSYMASQNK